MPPPEETEFRNVLSIRRILFLPRGTSFKFTHKYKRLRRLVWTPIKKRKALEKRKKYRFEREISPKI